MSGASGAPGHRYGVFCSVRARGDDDDDESEVGGCGGGAGGNDDNDVGGAGGDGDVDGGAHGRFLFREEGRLEPTWARFMKACACLFLVRARMPLLRRISFACILPELVKFSNRHMTKVDSTPKG